MDIPIKSTKGSRDILNMIQEENWFRINNSRCEGEKKAGCFLTESHFHQIKKILSFFYRQLGFLKGWQGVG